MSVKFRSEQELREYLRAHDDTCVLVTINGRKMSCLFYALEAAEQEKWIKDSWEQLSGNVTTHTLR